MNLRRCPYCGSEMIGNMTSPICRNPECEFCNIPVPLQYVEDVRKMKEVLDFISICKQMWGKDACEALERVEAILKKD